MCRAAMTATARGALRARSRARAPRSSSLTLAPAWLAARARRHRSASSELSSSAIRRLYSRTSVSLALVPILPSSNVARSSRYESHLPSCRPASTGPRPPYMSIIETMPSAHMRGANVHRSVSHNFLWCCATFAIDPPRRGSQRASRRSATVTCVHPCLDAVEEPRLTDRVLVQVGG